MKSRWDKCWPGKHLPPGYPLMLLAARLSCASLTQRKGCKGRCPHLSLPSSASCVRPKWSQKERETMLLPQNLQHVSMQIGSQNLGLFPFLLLMKIDRPVAPLQWLASGIVHSRNSLQIKYNHFILLDINIASASLNFQNLYVIPVTHNFNFFSK